MLSTGVHGDQKWMFRFLKLEFHVVEEMQTPALSKGHSALLTLEPSLQNQKEVSGAFVYLST